MYTWPSLGVAPPSDTAILHNCYSNFSNGKDTPHCSDLTVGISIGTVQLMLQLLLQK